MSYKVCLRNRICIGLRMISFSLSANSLAILSQLFCKMKCIAIVFFITQSAFSGTYWVATNGVDSVGCGSEAEPFETIQYAIDYAEADSTILVKPGVYDKGWAINTLSSGAVHTNRVSLTKKIHLQSSHGACVTHIVGAPDPVTGGAGPGAIRCMVSPNGDSEGSTIVGFTLRDGYGDVASHRSGGFLQQNGNPWIYIQDCVVSNCVAFSDGGARGGTFARCFFANNHVTSSHDSSHPSVGGCVNLINCVIAGNGSDDNDFTLDANSVAINCTIVCNRGRGSSPSATLYNTIVCGNSNGDYTGSKAYDCVIGGYPVLSPLCYDWRVVRDGAADGSGRLSHISCASGYFSSRISVDENIISLMSDKDFAGNVIDVSAASMHVGAVQDTALVSGGILWLYGPLSCNGAYVPDGAPTYAQSTNGLGQWRVNFAGRKVSGSSTNYLRSVSRTSSIGNMTLFPDLDDSLVMMAPPKGGFATTNTPQYSKALWVDPNAGSNTSNDGSRNRPYRTIQKAVDEGGKNTVVFLAPGLYDEGGKQSEDATKAPYGSCRVWVTNDNVRIVGKAGAGQIVISGSSDTGTGGLGEKAFKCVGASGNGVVVQGVTISNGWTMAANANSGRGAAIRNITLTDSVVTDCHGNNNISYMANLYRCKIYGNEAQGGSLFETMNDENIVRIVSSWIGPNTSKSSAFYGYVGSETEAWFSTLLVTNGQSAFSQNAKIYNCIAVGGQYVKSSMISRGNLFWNFAEVDDAAVGTFANCDPRLSLDKMHVKIDSPAFSTGIAPSEEGYDFLDEISRKWHFYSSADVEGKMLHFAADSTAMSGASHEAVAIRGMVVILK